MVMSHRQQESSVEVHHMLWCRRTISNGTGERQTTRERWKSNRQEQNREKQPAAGIEMLLPNATNGKVRSLTQVSKTGEEPQCGV